MRNLLEEQGIVPEAEGAARPVSAIQERFRFGVWWVWPQANAIADEADGARRQLEPRLMQVLVALCTRPGEVLSSEQLLHACWGTTLYGDGPLHKAIAQLRKALGDPPGQARYIQTIRKRGYRTVAAVQRDALHASPCDPDPWRDGSPFRGLEPFASQHAAVFHGRARAQAELLACVRAQQTHGMPMALLLGPSGSGKTSLLQAGLLPALQDPAAGDLALHTVSNVDSARIALAGPWLPLAEAMLGWCLAGQPLWPGQPATVLARRLAEASPLLLTELRWQLDERLGRQRRGPALGLVVDQLEQVFLAEDLDEPARTAFVDVLQALAASGEVLVLLACRNDFYPQLTALAPLLALKQRGGHYDVQPPSQAEIAQMIRLPARAAGLRFGIDPRTQAHLDDVLCAAAAASPDALPLLQYALQQLYEARTPLGELSTEAYQRIGGLEGAVSYRAETVLAALDPRERACLPQILARLVSLAEDAAVVGRRVAWRDLDSAAQRHLVHAFVEARLLVSSAGAGDAEFAVAHEALLRRWPRAIAWIEQHRAALRVRARLAALAARWQEERRSHDLLLPEGRQLDEARQLLAEGTMPLGAPERALIAASARRAGGRRRLRIAAFGSIVGLGLAAGAFGLAALRSDRQAQAQRSRAEGLLTYMLGDFGDKLRPLGRLDLLEDISAKALAYLTDASAPARTAPEQRQRAQALALVAEVEVARGHPQQAVQALDAAQAILQARLAQAPHDVDALRLSGANAFWLGKIALDRNAWRQAQAQFLAYLQAGRRWQAQRPHDIDAWVEQSYALNSLGTLWLRHDALPRAADAFAASIALKRAALAQRPHDPTLTAELADSLTWQASAQRRSGALAEASRTYAEAIRTLEGMQGAVPRDALWGHRLATALINGAELDAAMGKSTSATARLQRAIALLDPLVAAQPEQLQWQRDRLYAQLLRARLAAPDASARSPSAWRTLADAAQALVAHDPSNAQWQRLLAAAQTQLALSLSAAGARVQAGDSIEAALAILQSAYVRNPDNINGRQALAEAWLASAQIAGRDTVGAHAACQRSADLFAAANQTSEDYLILLPWMRSQHCLGNDAAGARAARVLARIGYRSASHDDFDSPSTHGRPPDDAERS
ncbi:winged helix-turn-helix domain-containing protein [Xanthomonas sp. D-109]|uniref:nSTAND1 domain-containing NTPase n=1 Tax=Xanthomonas sp. D-109 TaxID=2821274 RepID=UPI001ADA2AF6|nr:winged helix-turn-helix domain-containing protein [Xanthomonas sp. D-109]MBO9880831.1 winged helix-turn-helix domain-containing protein [Xanthomonas sp. D-109]